MTRSPSIPAAAARRRAHNPNTLTRILACDNGRTVEATFAGEAGSNFNVSIDESVFIYKRIVIDRPPLGPVEAAR